MVDCEDPPEAKLNEQLLIAGNCESEQNGLNNVTANTRKQTRPIDKCMKMMGTSAKSQKAKWWKILGSVAVVILTNVITAIISVKHTKSSCGSRPATIVPPCPSGWDAEHGDKCYYFSESEGTWNSSQSNCSASGASLVVIEDQKEMDFINQTKGPTEYWIGLTRKDGQPWEWADGSIFNNWFEIRANGFCAYLDDDRIGSTLCGTKRNWICSKSAHIS